MGTIPLKFAVEQSAYLTISARRGELVEVIIAEIQVSKNSPNSFINYKIRSPEAFPKAWYLEAELMTFGEARSAAIDFLSGRIDENQQRVDELRPICSSSSSS